MLNILQNDNTCALKIYIHVLLKKTNKKTKKIKNKTTASTSHILVDCEMWDISKCHCVGIAYCSNQRGYNRQCSCKLFKMRIERYSRLFGHFMTKITTNKLIKLTYWEI